MILVILLVMWDLQFSHPNKTEMQSLVLVHFKPLFIETYAELMD